MKSMQSTIERNNVEELLKILGEKSPMGICIIQDGRFCYVNPSFPVVTGYTVDELVGKDSFMIVFPEDKEMVRDNTIKMLKGELLSPYEFRVICKDGSVKWIVETVRSIQYQGRQATLGNYMEITERKQMEDALKESEDRYRELADSITDVFFAMDEHLRYTYWNRASEILTGIQAEDAMGKSIREIFPDTDWRRRVEKVYREVLKTQQSQTFVNDFDINGRHYIFELSAYPSRGGISVFVRDITESRQAEERLKESEQKYRTILEEMGDGYFEVDLTGNLTFVNDAMIRILGYSKEEIIGMNSRALRPKGQAKVVFEAYNRMYKTGEPLHNLFTELVCKDGRHVFAEISAFPIRNEKGEIIGFRGIRRDITERKQTEEKLRRSKEKYRALFDSSVIGTLVVDAETMQVVIGNQAAANVFGFSSLEEALGVNILDFIPQEEREKTLELLNKEVFKQDSRRAFDLQAMTKDGREIWVNVTAARIMHKGKLAALISFVDITERKQTEERLRQSEENYRALFDSSVIGTFVMDAETMKPVMVNHAVAEMFGFGSVEEAIEVDPFEFVHPDDRDKVLALAEKDLFEQDLRQTHEVRTVTKDGREMWVSARAARIMHKGKLAGLISFIDITERKQAVETLRQSEERYRTILEEMEDSYFEVDLGGHFTFVNNATCRSLGYSDKELIGMSYKEITLENDIEPVFQIFNEVYRTGKPSKGYLWTIVRKDGTHRLVEHSAFPLRNDKGEIIGFRGVGRDITERKQAEEKLRQSEENYKTLFNSSVIGMYVMDAETMKIVMGNRAAAEMIGFGSSEEGIGVNPFDFVVPEDREKVLAIAINDFFQDSRRAHEIEVIDKNGLRRWQSISIARFMHEGRAASLVSFIDITERKRAEEKLRQSEEKYRTILEEMEDAYFEVDLGGHFTFFNNSVCRDLGYSKEELIGMSYKDFTVEDDIESVFRVFNEVYQSGMPNKGFPWKTIRKDGSLGFAETSVSPLRDDKGEIIGFRGTGRDVTERKQAEDKLRQSEENYRALFDSSVIGTFVLDAETLQVVMGNQAAANEFGFSSVEEVIGINPLDFIPPEDKERVLEVAIKEMFEKDLRETYELQAITKDGGERWISITGARIMHNGKLAGLIAFTDVTEQKQQREQLMIADRLASIGELAAGAAHELNNPLTSILGFSQLLMEMDIPDDIREDLTLIYSEAQRAANVTKNLLTFARKHAPVKQLNQINNIIEDVLKLRAYEHKINSIKIKRQLAPGLPEIMVDYFQIQQVLLNIIINAEYFITEAHNGGTLTITTKKQNSTVKISIADDGPGIPSEKLSRIFDPFFTTKEAGKGTGLGLSICHGIVTEHGGQIYARNQRSKGATIVVELPINGH